LGKASSYIPRVAAAKRGGKNVTTERGGSSGFLRSIGRESSGKEQGEETPKMDLSQEVSNSLEKALGK